MLEVKTRRNSSGWSSSFIVREDKVTYTKHDLLFKRLIETFFTEFMEAFFPDLYEKIDFKEIKFLSEEMVPVVHDNNDRRLDIVVEVSWRETNSIIVIHIEPQSYYQSDFHERMFHYFSLLYRKVEKPILPIALFSYDEKWAKDDFTMAIGQMEVLKFNYLTLHFKKMDWHDFIHQKNPVSAALLSKMGYNEREKVKVKIEFFRILTELEIDLEKQDILVDFFQTYLILSEEEEESFVEEVKKLDNADEILDVPVLYSERMKEIGREEGRDEEREEVALEMLRDGLSIERIMKYTQLKEERIEKIKSRL